ncbi:MAG: TlpA disulfide reductase family protein [Acidobacteria bacterium]|nr:TlpA disulfide reductase family protein [Acidobacteriota bacterium]
MRPKLLMLSLAGAIAVVASLAFVPDSPMALAPASAKCTPGANGEPCARPASSEAAAAKCAPGASGENSARPASATGGSSSTAKCVPGRCADYGACSLHGNLAFASGDTLAMYADEKKEDGTLFTDFTMPAFTALNLDGKTVSTGDLRDAPAVVAFLAGHCSHSHDSIPILNDLASGDAPAGTRVIGVWVNSGSVEDVASWMPTYAPTYEVWVHEDAGVGDAIGSHLVPTWFYLTPNGDVLGKLVGYKSPDQVRAWIEKLSTRTASTA